MIHSFFSRRGSISLALALMVLSACAPTIDTFPDATSVALTQQALVEQAAQSTATMQAMQQQIALLQTQVGQATGAAAQTQLAATTIAAVPTQTPIPPTPTIQPTETPVPPTATPTEPPIPCNAADFVDDVSIPDGTILPPGVSFIKTWRLQNVGACGWTTGYRLAYISGDRLGAVSVVALPASVAPGQVVDVSVEMVAPGSEGYYRGYWQVIEPSGYPVVEGNTNGSLYVDIRVVNIAVDHPYDFAAFYCLAEWTSGAGRLPCQGDISDSRGVARRDDTPVLEDGYIDDEPALVAQPQMITDGVIRGRYPSVRVESGYHFLAVIGCAHRFEGCDVNFQLDYQIGSGTIQTLGTWHEVYDGEFQRVDVDLSGLAGNDVRFILTVFANGTPNQDRVLWLAPRIVSR